MLKQLWLRNFQVHKSLDLELDPHVTTVIGPSDVGKSAIIRALRWVAFNRPSGEAFIRDGEKQADVTVVLTDRHHICRIKGSRRNTYQLDDQVYQAVGNDVPPQVAELLNISDINFQGQHDNPFWFSETAGEVSRQLNSVIDLGVIDSTLSNLASTLRKAKTEVSLIEVRAKEVKENRDKVRFSKRMDRDLQAAEAKFEEIAAASHIRSTVDLLLKSIQRHSEHRDCLLQSHLASRNALQRGEKWAKVQSTRISLETLLTSIKSLSKVSTRNVPDMIHLEEMWNTHAHMKARRQDLARILISIKTSRSLAARTEVQLKIAEGEFKQKLGKVCELCGQTIPS